MKFIYLLFFCIVSIPLACEEGMWLFNAPPSSQIKSAYGFEVTQPWLDHLRLSSVRFDNGGSGSFVSTNGLVFTNHHVAADCLHGLSTSRHDYVSSGFYASKPQDEPRCPNLELNVLEQISDVTDQVNSSVKAGMPDAQAGQAQRAQMAAIEKQCAIAPEIRCDVVTLYAGARFNLYRYKRYPDVRLVFAPEFKTAFFGGDPDNFEYPRYDLDVAFFRVYENGAPVHLRDFLRWSAAGAQNGELIFVSGHPGATAREDTLNQVLFEKNTHIPWLLADFQRRIALLEKFSARSPENARIAQEDIFGLQNNYKRYQGYLTGLEDQNLFNRKKGDERRLLVMSRRNPMGRDVMPAFERIDHALQAYNKIFLPYMFLARRPGSYRDVGGFRGQLAAYAIALVQFAAEREKPNAERLPEYRDSALPSLEQDLFSTAPIYKSLETAKLADSLTEMQKQLGPADPLVKSLLNNRSPQEVAQQAISQTRLDDAGFRRQLYQGGEKAVAASNDPMIALLRAAAPEMMRIRTEWQDEVDSAFKRNHAVIEQFRFATGGSNQPPDATFTLRLSYGTVKGYVEDGRGIVPNGTNVPPFTAFSGAFQHAAKYHNHAPYDLPQTWYHARSHLSLQTALNFVSTADIIGGNSGSPVVNRRGELVGIIFDGNIQSLPWNFEYDDRVGRAVSVDSRGILEALRKIYHARELADELNSTEPKQ